MANYGPYTHPKVKQPRWGNQSNLVLSLLGFIFVYQVFYQGFLLTMLHNDEHELEDACGGAMPPHWCMEHRLFAAWREEALQEDRRDLLQTHIEQVVSAVAEAGKIKAPDMPWDDHRAELRAYVEAQHEAIPAERHAVVNTLADILVNATLDAVHNESVEESIDDFRARLFRYREEHERKQQERMERAISDRAQREARFDKLYNDTLVLLRAPPTPSPFILSLRALQDKYTNISTHAKRVTKPDSRLRGAKKTIRWETVSQWSAAPRGGDDAGLLIATHEDLRHLEWSGPQPRVACITMVPSSLHSVHQMRYFVDNWRLQDWEPKELVLVYQYGNRRLADVVHKYANETSIRAVVARDGEFPSTAALRYGAWSVKADVIARWDFDEWHHPEQLTLQTNALGLTSRPCSLLQPVGTHGANSTDRESTILGEAKWMREAWYPFLKHGSDILEDSRAHHLVQVDAPQLDINAKNATDSPSHDVGAEAAEGLVACSSLLKAVQSVEFMANTGQLPAPDLKREYEHLAVTGHDVDARLRELCTQASEEIDAKKRAELYQQAARLSSFEAEISKELLNIGSAIELEHP